MARKQEKGCGKSILDGWVLVLVDDAKKGAILT